MRLLGVILVLCSTLLPLRAQEFTAIRLYDDTYYERNDTLYTVRFDSNTVLTGGDTMAYFPTSWGSKDGPNCIYSRDSSYFFGRKVIKENEHKLRLFNRYGDTLFFNIDFDKPLGSSFNLMENDTQSFEVFLKDTIYSFGYKVLDTIQNVSIYNIEVKDSIGNPLTGHPFYGKEFEVSQYFGFNKLFNWWKFPNDTTQYNLVGATFRDSTYGTKGLDFSNIFNILPGYERHYREDIYMNGQISEVRYYKLFTLEQMGTEDSIVLLNKRSMWRIKLNPQDTTFVNDTVESEYLINDYSFLEKIQSQIGKYYSSMYNDSLYAIIQDLRWPNGTSNYVESVSRSYQYNDQHDCISNYLVEDSLVFGQNLGIVFHKTGYSGNYEVKQLVYFKKGVKKWGEPIDFTFATGISERGAGNFSVEPNPFSTKLQIRLDTGGKAKVRIFDLMGRLVHRQDIQSSCTLTTDHLKRGVYILEVSTSHGRSWKKVVKNSY